MGEEFPGIGVQKSADSPRLYRQSDVDQVLRIKRLVFSEGLTLSGARRKLEEAAPRTPADADEEVAEVLDALASDARTRIAYVRDGLRSILQLLSHAPGRVVVVDDDRANGGRPAQSAPAVRVMPQQKARRPRRRHARPGRRRRPGRRGRLRNRPAARGLPSRSRSPLQ